jgi:hypothetical protein
MEENENTSEQKEYEKTMEVKVIDAVEELINGIIKQGIDTENLESLYKLIDIHKDIHNEKYWKMKESEIMRYDNYGNYGRYDNYNTYDRRGMDRRYRGHDYMDNMYNGYSRYEEGREQYNRGNYNAKDDTLRSLQYMLESAHDFFQMLKSEAGSQEEMQMIREYAKKISEM